MDKPLLGRKVTIATPCGSGKLDVEYVVSLVGTLYVLEQLGAKVDWFRLPGCSDLPYARSKIFGHFLRSDFTDMILVDDDMGWEPYDIVRLLQLNRDFIGGVGPKKQNNPEYCVNSCDDYGNTIMMPMELTTGVTECTEVGLAFMMMSKSCAERMARHYTDLEFYDKDGVIQYGLYDGLILPGTKRRLAEDFAFCHRWRKIGGKVEILPDIALKHCGKAVWEGQLLNHLNRGGNGTQEIKQTL